MSTAEQLEIETEGKLYVNANSMQGKMFNRAIHVALTLFCRQLLQCEQLTAVKTEGVSLTALLQPDCWPHTTAPSLCQF